MPLTPYLVTNTSSIPVGATKSKYGKKMVARTHASHTLSCYEHRFDSRRRYKKQNNNTSVFFLMPSWRFRLVARTHASHAWNTGSIPVGATKSKYGKKMVARTHVSHTLSCYEHEFDSRRRYKKQIR